MIHANPKATQRQQLNRGMAIALFFCEINMSERNRLIYRRA